MPSKKRTATVKRKTTETNIAIKLDLDGSGKSKVATGIPFLDHMLTLFAKHGLFDLDIKAKGDLEIDIHHTNEDLGITLGEAFNKALGQKKSIQRYGLGYVPMEEALVRVVLDFSGRSSVNFVEMINLGEVDGYSLSDVRHFLEGFCRSAGITLSVGIKSGSDMHHVLEALFKGLALACKQATRIDKRIKGVPSTKGRI